MPISKAPYADEFDRAYDVTRQFGIAANVEILHLGLIGSRGRGKGTPTSDHDFFFVYDDIDRWSGPARGNWRYKDGNSEYIGMYLMDYVQKLCSMSHQHLEAAYAISYGSEFRLGDLSNAYTEMDRRNLVRRYITSAAGHMFTGQKAKQAEADGRLNLLNIAKNKEVSTYTLGAALYLINRMKDGDANYSVWEAHQTRERHNDYAELFKVYGVDELLNGEKPFTMTQLFKTVLDNPRAQEALLPTNYQRESRTLGSEADRRIAQFMNFEYEKPNHNTPAYDHSMSLANPELFKNEIYDSNSLYRRLANVLIPRL